MNYVYRSFTIVQDDFFYGMQLTPCIYSFNV